MISRSTDHNRSYSNGAEHDARTIRFRCQMTLRTRALLSSIGAFLVALGFMLASALAPNHLYSIAFGALAFIFLIPGNMWVRSIFRCPVCGTSVFEMGGSFSAGWPARTCSKCRADLKNRQLVDDSAATYGLGAEMQRSNLRLSCG